MFRLVHLTLIGCLAAVCIGCGKTAPSQEAPPAASAPEPPQIALIMKSLANEFFLTMEQGAIAHQTQNAGRYELIAQGIKNETDVAQQVQLVEQMISREVDAIVIAPADSKALVGVCKRAIDSGIKVVNIDNRFDEAVLAENSLSIPFVGPDNRKGAHAVAAHVAKSLQPGDPVAIVEGAPNAFNATERKLGFENAINAAQFKLVASQSGNWEMDRANDAVSAMLGEHPDLKAIFCANDSMALGAVAALRAAGKLGQVKVAGFDNISAVQELLKDGTIAATADQHGDQLAVFGIEHALAILAGEAPGDKETPVDLITAPQETAKP